MALVIDFSGTSGVVAVGATSASATLPANTDKIGLMCSGSCHFRLSSSALATAVSTDPLLTPNAEPLVLSITKDMTTVAAIQDGSATGVLSFFRVQSEDA